MDCSREKLREESRLIQQELVADSMKSRLAETDEKERPEVGGLSLWNDEDGIDGGSARRWSVEDMGMNME